MQEVKYVLMIIYILGHSFISLFPSLLHLSCSGLNELGQSIAVKEACSVSLSSSLCSGGKHREEMVFRQQHGAHLQDGERKTFKFWSQAGLKSNPT